MTAQRHEQLGWGMVALFALLGLVLETLHGLKLGGYLSTGAETRRLLWTLGHAHGVLLGLVHLAFAATLRGHDAWTGNGRVWAKGIRFELNRGRTGIHGLILPPTAALPTASSRFSPPTVESWEFIGFSGQLDTTPVLSITYRRLSSLFPNQYTTKSPKS